MPNFCNLVIAGHLGADPELAFAPSGLARCTFSVATTTGYGDNECTTWRRVTVFGKRGEAAAKHLQKGSAVIVAGEEQNRPYDTDNGKRFSLEIIANSWSFADSKKPGGGGASTAQDRSSQAPAAGSGGAIEDDLPFAPIRGLV